MAMKQKKQESRPWHELYGELLQLLLSPVDITVLIDPPVMSKSPKMDILILRNNGPVWTPAQRERLPEGIRD